MKTKAAFYISICCTIWIGCIACNSFQSSSNQQKETDQSSLFTPDKFDIKAIRLAIAQVLEKDTLNKADTVITQQVETLYRNRQFEPIWIYDDGIRRQSNQLLLQLDSLQYHALPIQQYTIEALTAQLKQLESMTDNRLIAEFDVKMTRSYLSAVHDLMLGTHEYNNQNKDWKSVNDTTINWMGILNYGISNSIAAAFDSIQPKHPLYKSLVAEYARLLQIKNDINTDFADLQDSISNQFTAPVVAVFRKKLFQEIGMPSDTVSLQWGQDIQQAIEHFQYTHQMKVNGKIDTATKRMLTLSATDKLRKIALNLDRMRSMQNSFKQPCIWVNIPTMELDYYDQNKVTFNMRVVVGRPSRKTPTLDAKIENIVLSPPWNVPPTIMKEEVVPGIARRGGAYLARRGLKAYDYRGRPVNPSVINASNFKRFNISQAPGYRSSLGEVKFNMPNPWAIYLHDTPHREDFPKSYRAFSSGCIRVHKPKEFAAFLLQDPNLYSYEKIDSICKKRKTIFIPYKKELPVHIVYLTNAIDSAGNIRYLKDIYGWDKLYN